MSKQTQPDVTPNPVKDPDQWKTGDEPMTGPQKSYLETLAQEAGEEVDENLTKAEASKAIDELQEKTGRGASGSAASLVSGFTPSESESKESHIAVMSVLSFSFWSSSNSGFWSISSGVTLGVPSFCSMTPLILPPTVFDIFSVI